MPPDDHADYDQRVMLARSALGEEAFAAAWEAGRVMTMEQAVEYAMKDVTA